MDELQAHQPVPGMSGALITPSRHVVRACEMPYPKRVCTPSQYLTMFVDRGYENGVGYPMGDRSGKLQ